jgi:uncharacterized protein
MRSMNNTVVVCQLQRAESMFSRMVGLLGRSSLPQGHGLLISPCNQVHTFFMKFAIDVVFLDSSNCVVKLCPNLKPWRLTPIVWKAKAVLELPQGEASGLRVGCQLQVIDDTVKIYAQ